MRKIEPNASPPGRLTIAVNLRTVQYFINILFAKGCFVFQMVLNTIILFRKQDRQI